MNRPGPSLAVWSRWLLAVVAIVCMGTAEVAGQSSIQITGDRLSGFVLPVEPITGDIELSALRGSAWTIDDTKRLLLEEDVEIAIGAYRFQANAATVWINRIPSAGGLINQIAVYFDEVIDPAKASGAESSGLDAVGEALLITASARGEVELDVGSLQPRAGSSHPVVRAGRARLAEHLRRIAGGRLRLQPQPRIERPAERAVFRPVPGGSVTEEALDLPTTIDLPTGAAERLWLKQRDGSVRFSAERVEFTPGEMENTITATGSIIIDYTAPAADGDIDQLTLTATRGVIFTEPGRLEELAGRTVDAEFVRGIYLEGAVIATLNNGQYIVRTPRAYYDFTQGRAVMMDAILRTYARENRRVPVYARAAELRQIAANEWEADRVRVSTSEFFTPHVALGAERMRIVQPPADDGTPATAAPPNFRRGTYFESEDNTLRFSDVPVAWFPRFAGEVRDLPLRSITGGTEDNNGLGIETRWDLFGLIGLETPDGLDGTLRLDGYTARGAGAGVDFTWSDAFIDDSYGELNLYGLYDDGGTDRTIAGRELEPDRTFRGYALLEHHQKLSSKLTAQVQGAFISDETYMTTWRRDWFRERREFETSGYLKHQDGRAAVTLLGKYNINDFISNGWLLASRQYTVDKVPELTLRWYGLDLFDGAVTWSQESRVGRMKFSLEEHSMEELGVRSGLLPGVDRDTPIEEVLRARGFSEQYVNRADTRHELTMPLSLGALRVVPFVVGRLTAYSEDFEAFSSDAEDVRSFGAVGVRIATELQRVWNDVQNRTFDLHRLRHIIEPSVTLWTAHANTDDLSYPVYDEEVESIATGSVIALGLRNTLQTQRQYLPGQTQSVDVFTLDTTLVFNSGDANRESPTAQFFDYRPEYSQVGDHIRNAMIWKLSDTFAIVGDSTVDLDESALARGSIGFEMRHNPRLTTYAEFRYIDASDTELLDIGWRYQFTKKYRILLRPQWDFREDEFRSLTIGVTRQFPDFEFEVRVRHDAIRDDTTVGASVGLVQF